MTFCIITKICLYLEGAQGSKAF